MALQPGTIIDDHFRLVREIGRGAYGVVFEAEQLSLGRRVALKILLPKAALCSASRERFRREARIASNLWHPQAVHIYHCGFHESAGQQLPYLAMEYLVGEDLHQYMSRHRRISSDETRTLIRQALDPLIEAHDRGVIHRDLKPENLFLCFSEGQTTPRIKVLDFGIAQAMQGNWSTSMIHRLTLRGGVCGTPHYMAPELIQGDAITPAIDIYALGCIAYEMVAGCPPFQADTPFQLMMLHCDYPPQPLPEDTHPGLRRAITRALAKNPMERPSDARAFAQALDELECDTDEWPHMMGELVHLLASRETRHLRERTPMAPSTGDPEDPARRRTVQLRRIRPREAGRTQVLSPTRPPEQGEARGHSST